MPIDTSLYQNLLRPPKSVADYQADIQQAEGNALALQQNKMNLLAAKQAMEDDQRLRELYARPDFDPLSQSGVSDVMRVSPKAGMALQKSILDAQEVKAKTTKAQAEAEKEQLQTAIAKQAQIAQAAGAAVDQASWDRGLQIAQSLGVDISNVPRQFDPRVAEQIRNQAMTGAQQLEQYWKQKGFDQQEHFHQDDVATTRRGQDITAATARRGQDMVDARSREQNTLTKEAGRSQVIDTPNGVIIVDKGTGTSKPVVGSDGVQAQGHNSAIIPAQKMADQIGANISMARDLLPKATGSGIGARVDQAMNFVGKTNEGDIAASQLETLAGWLTSNVPRMQGPQSDKDTALYRQMAAQVGDRTKPVSVRLKALDTLEGLQQKYAEANHVMYQPAKSKSNLTPAEQAELEALRKRFAR